MTTCSMCGRETSTAYSLNTEMDKKYCPDCWKQTEPKDEPEEPEQKPARKPKPRPMREPEPEQGVETVSIKPGRYTDTHSVRFDLPLDAWKLLDSEAKAEGYDGLTSKLRLQCNKNARRVRRQD